MPKVSVIICTYNRASLLARAIDSVLSQDLKDLELIIIDDNSNDETEKLTASYQEKDKRVKYYKNDFNLGVVKSRNQGVGIAQAEYIAMLDSDDWWLKDNKLSLQVDFLEKNLAVGLVGTTAIWYDKNDNFIKEQMFELENDKIKAKILYKNQFNQSSILFRKTAYTIVGGYDESLIVAEGLDFFLKIGTKYELANLEDPLTAYFVNPEGLSRLKRKQWLKTLKLLASKYKMDYPGYLRAKFKSSFNPFKKVSL